MPGQMPQVYEGNRPYIFVCYAHADRDAVLPIIRALVDEGYRVWYDDGIQAATHYPKYIADHVYGCASFVMFVSHRSLNSNWCNDEANYALDLRKNIFPVYLEKAELTRDLQMRMGHTQALYWNAYDSGEAFCEKLFEASVLDPCLTDEGKQRRGVKPKIQEPEEKEAGATGLRALKPKTRGGEAEEREVRGGDKSEKDVRPTIPEGPVTDVVDDDVQTSRASDNTSGAAPKADVGNEPPKVTPGFQSTHREGVQARRKVEREARRTGDKSARDAIESLLFSSILYFLLDESARDVNTSRKPANVRVAAQKDRHPVTLGEPGRPIAVWALVAVVATLMIAAIVFGALNLIGGLGRDAQREPNDAASVEETGTDANDNDGASRDAFVDGVDSKTSLGDYSWGELKLLSEAITDVSDDEWLDIAKAYNLVDADGKLQGDEKAFKLNDGTEASVRILGFRHDELEDDGKAGISFEFVNVPVTHRMNAEETNAGGWEQSEMRAWLNSDFLSLLPPDLQSCIETAKKQTNNKTDFWGFVSVATLTTDRLWLLSSKEVYVGYLAMFDPVDTQYKLYADQGVSEKHCHFCQKRGADSWWWLRSPGAYSSSGFLGVSVGGISGWNCADEDWGVSPGFCF